MPRVRHRSEAVDVDHGQLVYPSLEDVAVVMSLDKLAPGGGRSTAGETGGGSSGSPRCVRIVRIGPVSRTGSTQQPGVAKSAKARDGFALGKQPERNQPDVAAAVRALERKLLSHPRQQFRPCNP